MSNEYAGAGPQACWEAIDAAMPAAQLSGIVGDSAHTYGYHRGRAYVSSSDYSVQQADDQAGPSQAASALDVTLNDADMKTVSKRLNAAVDAGDSRLHGLREWYGTTDGHTVTGRDVRTGRYITSDDSHLWHVHLSFYRRWADDETECRKIAAVFTGGGTSGTDDDMPKQVYIGTGDGKTTTLKAKQTWYTVGWTEKDGATGGASLILPGGTVYIASSAWLYCAGLDLDDSLYWRIQVMNSASEQIAAFPVGEQRGTAGKSDLQMAMVGTVSNDPGTKLRLLVSSTAAGVVIEDAWWRCLCW